MAALLCAGFYEAVDGFKRKNDFKAVSLEITSICLFFSDLIQKLSTTQGSTVICREIL